MFVNHFNSHLDGGAATAARRLHAELLKSGTDSRFYYSASEARRPDLDETYLPTRWASEGWMNRLAASIRYRVDRQAFKKVTRNRREGLEVFTSPKGAPHTPWPPLNHGSRPGHSTPGHSTSGHSSLHHSSTGHPNKDEKFQEVIHLHWIAKFINQPSFFGSLAPDQPVIRTLHDMNAFTGGCHFSKGCDRYLSGCGHCPQLPNAKADDISARSFQEKQKAIRDVNLHVVAPSRWLIQSARSSLMFKDVRGFHHIPYGIDADIYRPMDKDEARARLGIEANAKVVCFGAMDVTNLRKGGRQMVDAFAAIADIPGILGLVFGESELPRSDKPMPPIHRVGLIRGTLQQRTVYCAADVFVLPSLEDNLPLTGLEAMACGTPIVGFNAGGIPDYVRPGRSGMLAQTGSSEDLGRQLRHLIADQQACVELGRSARSMIISEYSANQEASKYRRLYETLITSSKPNLSSSQKAA